MRVKQTAVRGGGGGECVRGKMVGKMNFGQGKVREFRFRQRVGTLYMSAPLVADIEDLT